MDTIDYQTHKNRFKLQKLRLVIKTTKSQGQGDLTDFIRAWILDDPKLSLNHIEMSVCLAINHDLNTENKFLKFSNQYQGQNHPQKGTPITQTLFLKENDFPSNSSNRSEILSQTL